MPNEKMVMQSMQIIDEACRELGIQSIAEQRQSASSQPAPSAAVATPSEVTGEALFP